jgi:hypothetical protein
VDISEIRDWFQGYLDAFGATVNDAAESGGMLNFCAVPLIVAGNEEAQVLTSEEDVLALMQGTASALQSDHYSHSELLDSHLIEINRSTTLFRGEFSRRRVDGTEIQRIGAFYLMARSVSGLRIFALAPHSDDPVARNVLASGRSEEELLLGLGLNWDEISRYKAAGAIN